MRSRSATIQSAYRRLLDGQPRRLRPRRERRAAVAAPIGVQKGEQLCVVAGEGVWQQPAVVREARVQRRLVTLAARALRTSERPTRRLSGSKWQLAAG